MGKRGSYRVLVAARLGQRVIFLFGFAKKDREDVSPRELRALKTLAKELLDYDQAQLAEAARLGRLIRLKADEDGKTDETQPDS